MTHPTPPNLLMDDEDVILLTDEIPQSENNDMIEICQIDDRSESQDALKQTENAKEKPAVIDLSDVIEAADIKTEITPEFSVSESDILNFDLEEISFSTPPNKLSRSGGLFSETTPLTPAHDSGVTSLTETEFQEDDLQRLIDEVVHDSQVPPQDFSGVSSEISEPKTFPVAKDELFALPQDRIDAAMERVIRNLFAEKIEPILDEVITASVNREIENLKTVLLDYLSSRSTVHNVKI
jgi:hypothetical protein